MSVCVHCVFYFPCLPLIYSFTGIKKCDVTGKKKKRVRTGLLGAGKRPRHRAGPSLQTYLLKKHRRGNSRDISNPSEEKQMRNFTHKKTRGVSWSSSLEKQSLGQNGDRCSWGVGEGQRAVGRVS